jgi:DNA-directed RNA polymerase beta' subunit
MTLAYESNIDEVHFYVLGDQDNRLETNVIINNRETFRDNEPVNGGVYDFRCGTTENKWICGTCRNKKGTCPGHIGAIHLNHPVKSPAFREILLKWLKIICFNCGNLVVDRDLGDIDKSRFLSEYTKLARTVNVCPHCRSTLYNVAKHKNEPFKFLVKPKNSYEREEEKILSNEGIKSIVERVRRDTLRKVGIPYECHPGKFILSVIRAPPNTIRPDVKYIGGNRSTSSDITASLKRIVEINNRIEKKYDPEINLFVSEPKDKREILKFNLEIFYYELVKGTPGNSEKIHMTTGGSKSFSSLAGRIPTKRGRLRKNILGKRANYMARSVITGDNMLHITEVGIPLDIAKQMPIPETVRPYNIDRLKIYYNNGTDRYPGCSKVIKKENGKEYKTDRLLERNYRLQLGDIVYRHILTGDDVGFNRQPSLLFCSISCHRAVVLKGTNTLRLNVCACSLYNADFDGDEMNVLVPCNIQSINEIKNLSSIGNWFVSYQGGLPVIGSFQDSLIGMAELTRNGVRFNKWHAMNMFSTVNNYEEELDFKKESYSNRELVSMILPDINLKKNAKIYMPQYAKFMKYDPEDITVKVNRGKLESGILDKSTVGQNTNGSIFHIINNKFGSEKALDTVYSFQQMSSRFFLYKGFTVGMEDINLSEETIKKIKENINIMKQQSMELTEQLNRNEFEPMPGVPLYEDFERKQMNILEPGDDFVYPIFSDIDLATNNIVKLVLTGSKGKKTNIISINGALGTQSINDRRPEFMFGYGRVSPYFQRFDMSPEAMGYVPNSYKEGIAPYIFPLVAWEARFGLISNALSTSITGYRNRLSVKTLESILVDNFRKSAKPQSVIQFLYAESGWDPRKLESIKFPTVSISDMKMEKEYCSNVSIFKLRFRNKKTSENLNEEYKQLLTDRETYRDMFLTIEKNNPSQDLFEDKRNMPVNINRIINDTYNDFKDKIKDPSLDPNESIEKVKGLCNSIPYLYYNEIYERKRGYIPEYIIKAVLLMQILIRSLLCTANLAKNNISNQMLEIIIDKIKITFKESLVPYGLAVGVIAGECISEPMTQYVLDSKHRAGGGGTKTNTIERAKEIFNVSGTAKMKNPSMLIIIPENYEEDKIKVQNIANHIEMMRFGKFVNSTRIFFEEYKNPLHSEYKHEKKMIENFEKYNLGKYIPEDITKWCIRFGLDKDEMMLNSMKLSTIITSLSNEFPEIFLVYTQESADNIMIRCYIRRRMFPRRAEVQDIISLSEIIKDTVIRGVEGIYSATIISIVKSYKDPDDKSIRTKKVFAIDTAGTNLERILENPYIDKYQTQTDSITEFEEMYGIQATRDKIIAEIRKVMEAATIDHLTLFADEMTYTGKTTGLNRSGMEAREKENVLLRVGFQYPIQNLEEAAINGFVSKVNGITAKLMVGSTPKIGTLYNDVIVNERFVQENQRKLWTNIEDIFDEYEEGGE